MLVAQTQHDPDKRAEISKRDPGLRGSAPALDTGRPPTAHHWVQGPRIGLSHPWLGGGERREGWASRKFLESTPRWDCSSQGA